MKKTWAKLTNHQQIAVGLCIMLVAFIGFIYFFTGRDPSLRHVALNQHSKTLDTALTNDAKYAIIIDDHNDVSLWNLDQNKLLNRFTVPPAGESLADIAIDDSGAIAYLVAEGFLSILDLTTGEMNKINLNSSPVTSVAVSPNGNTVVMGSESGSILVYQAGENKLYQLPHHEKAINDIDISADEHYVLSGSDDHVAQLWDLQHHKLIWSWQHDTPVSVVALSPHNQYAMTNEKHNDQKGAIKIWGISNGELLAVLDVLPVNITSAEFSPDDNFLAVGCTPQTLQLWDIQEKKLVKEWILPTEKLWQPTLLSIHAIGFSPDNKTVTSGDSQGVAHIWALPKDND